ncbi:transposase [Anaerovorax sp. IOR16]|uniref:transposase n=1 Tax=Anaerovorax sp. IOR16 TaxID=2773458 RepID=UPI003FA413C6
MMGKKDLLGRDQFQMVTLNSLVPQDHIIRKIDTAINLSFIYDLVKDLYSDVGKESIDPVVLIKITLIQYTFGIRSMRQTIKEIQTNVAYRWYLGYSLEEEIPHFSTFGKTTLVGFKILTYSNKSFKESLLKSWNMNSLIQKAFSLTVHILKQVQITITVKKKPFWNPLNTMKKN